VGGVALAEICGGMSGWLDKIPHACFKANFPSALNAKEEISGLLESRLSARFGAAHLLFAVAVLGVLLPVWKKWGGLLARIQNY
jgi:hypothetical protein